MLYKVPGSPWWPCRGADYDPAVHGPLPSNAYRADAPEERGHGDGDGGGSDGEEAVDADAAGGADTKYARPFHVTAPFIVQWG